MRPTELERDVDRYAARVAPFGARPLIIDGHDLAATDQALTAARSSSGDQPTVVLAP